MVYREEQIRRYTATGVLLLLLVFLAIALSQFISVLFGALIIVTLFGPFYRWLTKRLSRKFSAVIVCIVSTIVIAIPIVILSGLVINEASNLIQQRTEIINRFEALDAAVPQIELGDQLNQALVTLSSSMRSVVISAVGQITKTIVGLIILYLLIYFMLVYNKEAVKGLKRYIPFNKSNTEELMTAFTRITNTTVLGAGLVAIVQGAILGIGLAIAGVGNPVLLGFVGAVLSFLPIVGIALVWLPAAFFLLAEGSIGGFIIVLVTGGIITGVDYVLRMMFQEKQGNIHPIISIIGVIIGIQYFGIFGIVIGPLLLSYMVLTIHMFMEEHVSNSKQRG